MTCAEIIIQKVNESGRKIAVWGTGKDSVKATYTLEQSGLLVEKYVSGTGTGEMNTFMGKPVIYAENCLGEDDLFYLVAVREIYWDEVKNRLLHLGLEETVDFVFWKMIDTSRKMVMLHGNCHLDIVSAYLVASGSFNRDYWIYPYERVCNLAGRRGFDCVIPYVDVWIYQPIRKDNSICFEISDEYMLPMLREDAIRISVPNYYGLGKILFPQTSLGNQHNPPIADGRDNNGIFPRQDAIIDAWVKEHDESSIGELIAFCCSDTVMDPQEILDNYQQMMEKIYERDAGCDVKVSDFIDENFRKYQMFYDLGHPTNIVLKRVSEKILDKLGIGAESEKLFCAEQLCVHEDPVYPQVRRMLGLEWEQERIRDTEDSKKIASRMDFQEYIREYIWWCYGWKS